MVFASWVLGWLWRFATSPEGAAFGSFLSGVAALLAVLVASVGGYFGFMEWKRELHGKAKFQVARKVLLAAYDYTAKLEVTRRARIFRVTAPAQLDAPPETAEAADEIERQYRIRLDRLGRSSGRLALAEEEVKAIFGSDFVKETGDLGLLGLRLWLTADTFFPSERSRIVSGQKRTDIPGLVDEARELFETEGDEMATKRGAALKGIEERFRSYLR